MEDGIDVKVMILVTGSKAGMVGYTNLLGIYRESLNFSGNFPFPGKAKIQGNRRHYVGCIFPNLGHL